MESKATYTEIEINLKDLFNFILEKWKFLILVGIASAVLFTGMIYYLNARTYKLQKSNYEIDIEERLNDDEKISIQDAVLLKEQIKNKEEYINESLLMRVNANEKPESLLRYSFSGLKNENVLDDFVSYIVSDSCLEQIKEQLGTGLPFENKYIRELISVEILNDDGKTELFIVITHQNQETCEAIRIAVKQAIENYYIQYKEQLDCELYLNLESCNMVADSELFGRQFQIWDEWKYLEAQLSSIEKAMTKDELQYYQKLLGRNVAEPTPAQVNTKNVFLGGVIGISLGALYWSVIYILSGTLHNMEDVECGLGLSGLGVIKTNPSKRKEKAYDKKMSYMAQNIISLAEENNLKELKVISSRELGENYKEVIQDLKGRFSADLKITFCEDVNENAESVRQISQEKVVILIEMINLSKIKDITEIMRFCKNHKIQILGVLLIK